jgi:hypothetical protein
MPSPSDLTEKKSTDYKLIVKLTNNFLEHLSILNSVTALEDQSLHIFHKYIKVED